MAMTTLSPERVAEIRALAEKATPGPWEVEDEQNDGNFGGGPDCNSGYKSYAVVAGNKTVVDTLNSDLAEIEEDGDCEDGSWRYSRWDEVGCRNAAYIAALDPQTVLALLASHEALRAEVETMRGMVKPLVDDNDKLRHKIFVANEARDTAAREMREACKALPRRIAETMTINGKPLHSDALFAAIELEDAINALPLPSEKERGS